MIVHDSCHQKTIGEDRVRCHRHQQFIQKYTSLIILVVVVIVALEAAAFALSALALSSLAFSAFATLSRRGTRESSTTDANVI